MRRLPNVAAQDLFGQIAVSHADIELWMVLVAHWDPASWRCAWYIHAYDVVRKIQTAKAAGQWPPSRET